MSKRDCIVYEDSNSHWVHHVEWWCYVPSQEDLNALYQIGFSDTNYTALVWDEDTKISDNMINDLKALSEKYGESINIPSKELDKVLNKHGFVSASDYITYCRKAWIHGVNNLSHANPMPSDFDDMTICCIKPSEIRHIEAEVDPTRYYVCGTYRMKFNYWNEFILGVLCFPYKETPVPYDGWSFTPTGLYTEYGEPLMTKDDLVNGGYISGPGSYGKWTLNDNKIAELSGVLAINSNDFDTMYDEFYIKNSYDNEPYIYEDNGDETNINMISEYIVNVSVKSNITGLVLSGKMYASSFAFVNFVNCKFLNILAADFHTLSDASAMFVGFDNLEYVGIPDILTNGMDYSFLPTNNVSEIDEQVAQYRSSSDIENTKKFLRFTKYVQENGYDGLELSEYLGGDR